MSRAIEALESAPDRCPYPSDCCRTREDASVCDDCEVTELKAAVRLLLRSSCSPRYPDEKRAYAAGLKVIGGELYPELPKK